MAARLIVRVQVDLLPQFTDATGATITQVGVRLSALVDLQSGTLPVPPSDVLPDLCPWRWLSEGASTSGQWNPHDPGSWRLFRLDGPDPVEITGVTVPAKLDPGLPVAYATALDETVTEIVKEGAEAAICLPPEDQPIEHRTVFGLVESLTGLPHPVPAGMRLFTVLQVDDDLSDIRMVAIPCFRLPQGGSFDFAHETFDKIDPKAVITADFAATDASKWASALQVQMRASLVKSEMTRSANSARLVDLLTLTIGKNDKGTDTGDEDYAAHLPAKLAEALDPAARLIGAFDGVVEALRNSTDLDDQKLFADLREDLASVDATHLSALQTLLDAMTADVFRPMARASEAVPAVAISMFASRARERDSSGKRSVEAQGAGQLLLRMLDRDTSMEAFTPDRDRKRPPLMSYARLGAAVGLPPEEIAKAPKERPSLDGEAGLLEFVRSHWLAPLAGASDTPRPLTVGSPRHLVARVFPGLIDWPAQDEAVLDAGLFAEPGPRFILRLAKVGDRARLTIRAGKPPLPPTPPTPPTPTGTEVVFERSTADEVVASAGGQSVTLNAAGSVALSFALTLSADRSRLTVRFEGVEDPLEVVTPNLTRGSLSITLEALAGDVADFQPEAAGAAYITQLTSSLTAQGVRTDLSLAFAGPYLPGILAGQQSWQVKPAPTLPPEDFAEGIRDCMAALVQQLYTWLSESVANPPWLVTLIGKVIEKAREDAVLLAVSAVPSAALERITMDAPPLVVRIDQFQDFGAEDAWNRVAGYGALLGRTTARPEKKKKKKETAPQQWWTLNAAELVAVSPTAPTVETPVKLVDPVAIRVGQGGGVRQSLLSYNNRWLATGLATDTEQADEGVRDSSPRRPERLRPPSAKAGYLLPALSFGYSYWVLPYLIGHGGPLPLWLRDNEANPLVRRGTPGKPLEVPLDEAVVVNARTKTYLRTRPIGGPRFVETPEKPALPGVPENLPPLAAELPIRPAPITLEPGQSALFFRDASGQRGTLNWQTPADGELTGFRLLLGDVCAPGSTYGAKRTAVPELRVVLWGTNGNGMTPEELWSTTLTNVVHDLRLSLFVGDKAGLRIRIERQTVRPELAEDEGLFDVADDTGPAAADWHDMFVEVGAPAAPVQLEPPVAIMVQRGAADLAQADSASTSKSLIAPEASHRSRVISVFDGIAETKPHDLILRRPGVEFGTYERWINPALIETKGGPEQHKTAVFRALSDAYVLSTREPEETAKNRDASFEDPAVTAFCFELVEIFPRNEPIGMVVTQAITGTSVYAPDMSTVTTGDGRQATVQFGYNASSPALTSTSTTSVKAVLQPGHIYELRSYAVVAGGRQDFSPFDTLARLSDPVLATLRRVTIAGKDYVLASPTVSTIEVATTDLPDVYVESNWWNDDRLIALDRPPVHREDTARIYLPSGLTGADTERYRKTRYAATASLYSQRWSWRGHPQAEIESRKPSEGLLNSEWARGLAETAFTGRRNEDVGDIIVRRLEKAHIYGGRNNLDEPLRSPPSTALFTKALDWRAGLNLWRFGFSLTSRYAPLFPRQTSPERLAHLARAGAAWAVQAVPDRPSGRTIVRPGLALVLPLTEPLMAGGATPPLLALFNERVYANFNLADGIDVAVDMARHPFTFDEQKKELERLKKEEPKNVDAIRDLEHRLSTHIPSATDTLKHWQEFGPDPIRTGAAHDGSPILLRTDGPLGYTFDAETEAGRFDHAGLLLSPVKQDLQPWSMIKLRFRRLEAPEALDGFKPLQLAATDTIARLSGRRFPDKDDAPAVDYEGLLVEIPSLEDGDTTNLELWLGALPTPKPAPKDGQEPKPGVTVTAQRIGGTLTIAAKTRLGDAGGISLAVAPQETVSLRLVISGRERPEGVEKWTPQGDVAIKLRITNTQSGADVLEQLDRDRWLAVNCVPLSGSEKVGSDAIVALSISNAPTVGTTAALLRPVRLSPFTPSVWCQFAESMSVLAATVGASNKNEPRRVRVDELVARPAGKTAALTGLELRLRQDPGDAAQPAIISLATSLTTDPDAQLDQILLAVVTRYVTDAFARLRERPIGVVHLTDAENRPLRGNGKDPFLISLETGKYEDAWWGDEKGPLPRGNGGRLRFLRVLVPRSRELGGFVDATTRKLKTMFSQDLLKPDDLNPADAAGQILGISQPIEWK